MAAKPLHPIFTAISGSYDLVNRIVTLGLDQHWRRRAACLCLEEQPQRLLELACGTADLSLMLARLAVPGTEVLGLDYSAPMLARARHKARKLKTGNLTFVEGDAAALPFPDCHFDCVAISFAFRNLTFRTPITGAALAEVLRVLRPGGKFVIVETSQPRSRIIRSLFHFYMQTFVRFTGRLLSGHKGAFEYFAQSVIHFYTAAEVVELLKQAGFGSITCTPLLLGAAALHTARKH